MPASRQKPIPRLLVVSDAALAGADQLPHSVRALIDAAGELYVVTPSLPGRVSWIADEVDDPRHVAEERLVAVLHNMRSIGARVRGRTGDDSALTAVGDADRRVPARSHSACLCAATSTPTGRRRG